MNEKEPGGVLVKKYLLQNVESMSLNIKLFILDIGDISVLEPLIQMALVGTEF